MTKCKVCFQSVGTVKRHAASSQVLNELAAAAYAGVEVLKDSQTLVVSEFLRCFKPGLYKKYHKLQGKQLHS